MYSIRASSNQPPQSDDELTDRHEAMREGGGDWIECEVGGYQAYTVLWAEALQRVAVNPRNFF